VIPDNALSGFRRIESLRQGRGGSVATLAEKEPSSFVGRPVGAGGVGRPSNQNLGFWPMYAILVHEFVWSVLQGISKSDS
jgi:hypothetical protein